MQLKQAEKKLLGLTRHAIDEFELIHESDRICVGVSGGKDSMSLLTILAKLRSYYPVKFELEAVTISLGFDGFDITPVKEYCDTLKIHFTLIETEIAKIVFDERKENNPCSLCANMRRGAVNNAAKKLSCTSVALAHHKDDVVETGILSLFYEGRFHSFTPDTWLDRQQLHIIRPFVFVEEKQIREYVNLGSIPVVENTCPMDKTSQRKEVKDLIAQLGKGNPHIKSNLFGAIKRGLWDLYEDQN